MNSYPSAKRDVVGLVVLSKPGAGKQTVTDALLALYPSGEGVQISSGAIMAQVPAAGPYYKAQKPVPADIYYPNMRDIMPKQVLPQYTLAVLDGIYRYGRDVDELWDPMEEVICPRQRFMIELLHDDHTDLVERMRGRGRSDFSEEGAYDRITDYLNNRDAVVRRLHAKGFKYDFVDARQPAEKVAIDFFNAFAQLRSQTFARRAAA